MKHENKIGVFSIGTIKTFRGHEGESCLQGTIIRAGKTVGTWSEDAWGGPHQFQFQSESDEKEFTLAANQHPIAIDFAAEMEKKFGKPTDGSRNDSYIDLVVSTIAGQIHQDKSETAKLKRWCATQVVLKLPNSPQGEYTVFKKQYSPTQDESILKHFPGAEIVNKRFIKA